MYAEFYEYSRKEPGNLVRGPEERAVFKIDGRIRESMVHSIARDECKARGFDGYRLVRGLSIVSPDYITDIILVTEPPATDTDTKQEN